MPVLAHLDDPPQSRARGLLLGFAFALPVAAVFVFWVIPTLVDAILGGARGLDSRLRQEDAYMQALCGSDGFDVERDDGLCGCVLATEYPSLDCQYAFKHWTLERQAEFCSVPEQHERSLSFCSCVEHVAAKVAADPDKRDVEVVAYERCMQLPDAAFLPTIEALAAE